MFKLPTFKMLLAATLFAQAFVPSAHAVGPGAQCFDAFTSEETYLKEIALINKSKLAVVIPNKPLADVDLYQKLAAQDSKIAALFPQIEVLRILGTEEMPYFSRMLHEVLSGVEAQSKTSRKSPSAVLPKVLKTVLFNRVPKSSINARIASFMTGESPIERILGDMSLAETQELFHGGNPLRPTKDSLIGQYLTETGAAKLVRTFNQDPRIAQGEGGQSPRRLTVAVDAATFPIYEKLFNRVDLMTVIGHAQFIQHGKITSYNVSNHSPLRAMSANSILPGLILKTTEAQRLEFFLKVIANRGEEYDWSKPAMVPWKVRGFCSTKGAYQTCTHWIGNMPIGDKRVDTYTFPGAVDWYATNKTGPKGQDPAAPRVATLKPHSAVNPLIRKAFQAPGYAQLTDVIGQLETNGRGDWTNPGWLITALVGPTSVDHVPVVFVFANDAKAPIEPNFIPKYEAPL